MGEFDIIYVVGELDIGYYQVECISVFVEYVFGGFGVFVLNDLIVVFFKKQVQYFLLGGIVFDDECSCMKWL